MSTMALVEGPSGVVAAWETDGQIYFAGRKSGTNGFTTPEAAPGAGRERKHPALALSARGEMILVWTEGTGWGKRDHRTRKQGILLLRAEMHTRLPDYKNFGPGPPRFRHRPVRPKQQWRDCAPSAERIGTMHFAFPHFSDLGHVLGLHKKQH